MHIALLTGWISAERPISLRSSEWLQSFIAETSHTCDVYDIPTQIDEFLAKYQSYDIVFPYLHGRYGEDGIISGLCEALGLRYIGSPSTAHALCIDKFFANYAFTITVVPQWSCTASNQANLKILEQFVIVVAVWRTMQEADLLAKEIENAADGRINWF